MYFLFLSIPFPSPPFPPLSVFYNPKPYGLSGQAVFIILREDETLALKSFIISLTLKIKQQTLYQLELRQIQVSWSLKLLQFAETLRNIIKIQNQIGNEKKDHNQL